MHAQVMKFIINEANKSNCYQVDYCRYGPLDLLEKCTAILSSVNLHDHGFKAMRCKGRGHCLCMDATGRHLSFYDNKGKANRQQVPSCLSNQIGNAIFRYLNLNGPEGWTPLNLPYSEAVIPKND